jgi:hypothetical protein
MKRTKEQLDAEAALIVELLNNKSTAGSQHSSRDEGTMMAASVYPNAIHFYSKQLGDFHQSKRHHANAINLDDNEHNGLISYKARKRLEKCLMWLLYDAKPKRVFDASSGKRFTFKINFITLTLPCPQFHNDNEIKKRCLNNFLNRIRKDFEVENYVWRAEAQANGNIHFHIVSDKYIHYKLINKIWCESLELLGYISEFEKKWHHLNPPCTDVASVKHVRRLISYVSKYCSKNRSFSCIGELRRIKGEIVEVLYQSEQYRNEPANKKEGIVIGHVLGGKIRPIEGKLWSASQSLSGKKSLQIEEADFEFDNLVEFCHNANLRSYKGEFVYSWYGAVSEEFERLDKKLAKMLRNANTKQPTAEYKTAKLYNSI